MNQKIDISNLDPFNLHFEIFSIGDKSDISYFISEPSNLTDSTEKVNLSRWAIDHISNVLVSTLNESGGIDDFGFKIYYEFDPQSKDLILHWKEFNSSKINFDSVYRLTIRFYSLAYQREKTLNELLNSEEE